MSEVLELRAGQESYSLRNRLEESLSGLSCLSNTTLGRQGISTRHFELSRQLITLFSNRCDEPLEFSYLLRCTTLRLLSARRLTTELGNLATEARELLIQGLTSFPEALTLVL